MRWLALVAVLMVGGCTTEVGPSPAELKAQWDAQNVVPQNYKNDLMAFLRTYLNDPTHIRAAAVSQPQLKTGRARANATSPVCATTRASTANMPAPRMAPPLSCPASSIAYFDGKLDVKETLQGRGLRAIPRA